MEPFIIYSDHLLTMIQSDHFVDDGPNVLHLTLHHVPHLEELGLGLDEGPDPGGRPSEDDVPWEEGHELSDPADHLRDPEHEL